jgi:DNA-binding helix-hairpin-helix protein with protein kinase domain
MVKLFDDKGAPVLLGDEVGKGGEGAVFNVQGNPVVVAKVYFNSISRDKADKIATMASIGTERIRKLAAWPIGILRSPKGAPAGFLMPKVAGHRPMFELYGPKLRLQRFPRADWRFLIHSAANTARAFAAIHEAGHVVGDVNHGNLVVALDATVRFIDTDSFQITANGKRWLCEVGVDTHLPPELQGRNTFRGVSCGHPIMTISDWRF